MNSIKPRGTFILYYLDQSTRAAFFNGRSNRGDALYVELYTILIDGGRTIQGNVIIEKSAINEVVRYSGFVLPLQSSVIFYDIIDEIKNINIVVTFWTKKVTMEKKNVLQFMQKSLNMVLYSTYIVAFYFPSVVLIKTKTIISKRYLKNA